MALTQSAWSVKTVQEAVIATCTVTATTAENDAYTLATPSQIDCTRPFTLLLVTSATPDGQALPLKLWIGYGDSFALSGDSTTVAATNGGLYKQVFDDVVLAVTPLIYTFAFDPNLAVADVVTVAAIATGPKVKTPVVPRVAFNLDGGSTLAAHTATYTIIQKK